MAVQWGDDPEQRPIVPGSDSTFVRCRDGDEKTDVDNQTGQHNHAVERHQNQAGLFGDCGLAWPCERAELVALTEALDVKRPTFECDDVG